MSTERKCEVMENHQAAVIEEMGYSDKRRFLEVARTATRRAKLTSVTRIPVVVHVIHSNDGQNISDQQIHEQIAVLNQDFRATNADIGLTPQAFKHLVTDPLIEFALATRDPFGLATDGIVRKKTTAPNFPQAEVNDMPRSTVVEKEVKQNALGSAAWPRDEYLNIWVCDMNKNPLGFAAFPGAAAWRDGVVVDYKCFGISGSAEAPFNGGRTLTHELGHWLDLLHIWGDDGGACTRSDNIADTPNQAGPNYDSPTFPSVSCGNEPHGDLFMNYMDYVDDAAMYMFTEDQVRRMHSTLQTSRVALLNSKGLDLPDAGLTEQKAAPQLILEHAFPDQLETTKEVFDGVNWVPVESQ